MLYVHLFQKMKVFKPITLQNNDRMLDMTKLTKHTHPNEVDQRDPPKFDTEKRLSFDFVEFESEFEIKMINFEDIHVPIKVIKGA